MTLYVSDKLTEVSWSHLKSFEVISVIFVRQVSTLSPKPYMVGSTKVFKIVTS